METQQYAIEVTGLTKYFNGIPAVNHIDLKVKKGIIFGFLGPNGSGKTTTIRMLCGLLTPDAGSGYCLGYDILTESDTIKRNVGYMSQRFTLYEDLSIVENLKFMADIYALNKPNERVTDTLINLGLYERRKQLAGTLSGGWKQRLALAAALMHDPKLLLLDEPTAGVDPKARREFWDKIHSLAAQGITALVSTHYMDEAERCHCLAYIMKGQLLVQGTAQNIIRKSKLITFEVKGAHLAELAGKLRHEKGVIQVISYGQALHVSGYDQKQLTRIASSYDKNVEWVLTKSNLEDVFVSLVGQED